MAKETGHAYLISRELMVLTSAGSRISALAAIQMALAEDRSAEKLLQDTYFKQNIRTAAVDFGGSFNEAVPKILERALVAAKRERVISESHVEEGAVTGATHEAVEQIMPRAFGFNIGGKIAIARYEGHICVAIFFGIGLIHLDDVAIGFAHRAVS